MQVLVTGANGYIGSRLIPLLLDAGHNVRVLVRGASRLSTYSWSSEVSVVDGDLDDDDALQRALVGISVAFYLVHSMGSSAGEYRAHDRALAERFARAAAREAVSRIVFLGALGNPAKGPLSSHLLSRHETGEALARGTVPVLELRAGPIIGSGSLPFEMVRYLTERVPVMICPRWVFTKVQPLALTDALRYLAAAAEAEMPGNLIIEIGGRDVLSYGDMMMEYARVRGLRRAMVRVPVLTPSLSSYWVRWVTPLRTPFARQIVEGLRNEVVITNDSAKHHFPAVKPLGYTEAVEQVLQGHDPDRIAPAVRALPVPMERDVLLMASGDWEGIIWERRSIISIVDCPEVYRSFMSLGGVNEWPADWLWRARAAIDRLVGGVGLRRTGESERDIREGAALDFWTIEHVDERSVRLRGDMKMPGQAWLEFRCEPTGTGASLFSQTSYYAPRGLLGLAYWKAMKPLHKHVFDRMARTIIAKAKHVPAVLPS